MSSHDQQTQRLRLLARGAVQGVGFRPFVYRAATALGLGGGVRNTPAGVIIEIEGSRAAVADFVRALETERPAPARLSALEMTWLPPQGPSPFVIWPSDPDGERAVLLLPDLATCADCLGELRDPRDRRHAYPFTNCTVCGPRFSIVLGIPYDRERTTMRHFQMCPRCSEEYHDPSGRRFHAQPNACPACGPRLHLWTPAGDDMASGAEALGLAAEAVCSGQTLAVKGLGGFHLVVDAANEQAVRRLRQAKAREEKPLALMAPSLAWVHQACEVSAAEERLLTSTQAPIVLLASRSAPVAASVAPGNPNLGVMLPYTPLHHLLMDAVKRAIVATSGNRAEEPICTDEREALERLRGLADLFLVHDRPIARPIDDSVVRVVDGEEMILRRARGYAPLPVTLARSTSRVLAVGAQLKSTVALAVGHEVFLSQHVGDLETPEAQTVHRRACADLPRLYEQSPVAIACDLHPDYASTRLAQARGLKVVPVQHHHAHAVACSAENGVFSTVLGVTWDGTGWGADRTVWGGEFLIADPTAYRRLAHLRPFRLPGGHVAVREPRRSALGVLHAAGERAGTAMAEALPQAFSPAEERILLQALERGINAPWTSSAGRLFDAFAAFAGLRLVSRFEGQAAMELEFAAQGVETDEAYPFRVLEPEGDGPLVLDWQPLLEAFLRDRRLGLGIPFLSARFHNTLVGMIVEVAGRSGQKDVALTGGCFQNRRLAESAARALRSSGFRVLRHRLVPPNDGGIALGQAVVAAALIGAEES